MGISRETEDKGETHLTVVVVQRVQSLDPW